MLQRSFVRLAPCGWNAASLRAYVVTDDKYLDGPGPALVEKLVAAAEAGATSVQLRLKEVKTARYVELARATRAALDKLPHRPWLFIDDRLDVCLVSGADGLHIGDGDMDPADARRWLGDDRILGVSTYGEFDRIDAAFRAGADYVATGAIRASGTKVCSAKGVEPIPGIRTYVGDRGGLVSIGGVDAELARATCVAGCDGAAAVSYILEATTLDEVRNRTRLLREAAEAGVAERLG
eukprot:TRINITY_DN14141_c0_g5_i1.p2 TRINITY_DN14141_c0_g5~~TRINITY_DN14141_c0_g5_i1.p2  ORF type:complete len:237 (+),score=55.81 TRINITY_DN14141_c0_g5_i1:75-785(+)